MHSKIWASRLSGPFESRDESMGEVRRGVDAVEGYKSLDGRKEGAAGTWRSRLGWSWWGFNIGRQMVMAGRPAEIEDLGWDERWSRRGNIVPKKGLESAQRDCNYVDEDCDSDRCAIGASADQWSAEKKTWTGGCQ
jgi:hypothetical protein